MFARITTYRLKPGTVDTAKEIMEGLMPQIMGMPGLKQFINAVDADGNGYVVSIVESEEASNANQSKVQQLWAQFADVLAEPPVPGGYDVIMNRSNG